MNRADIRAFLSERNSFLTKYKAKDVHGVTRTAPDIISRAAQEHRINPKYLLVKLQKEQSLIDDKSPSQKQLDWATGYSVCDACKTTDPRIQKNKGFGKQVDSAAGIIRWYYENAYDEKWIKTANQPYQIDNQTVVPANNATAFLYTYTPHIHGNLNFWKLWQRWFDQVYPNGTMVTTPEDPTIYLVRGKTIHAFENWTALVTRFDPKLIVTVPSTELKRYEKGAPITLPNFSVLKRGNNYYLLDYDTIRKFESADVVRQLGYHPDEIIEVTTAELASYTAGKRVIKAETSPLGRLVRVRENGSLYYIIDGAYKPLSDEAIATVNFPHLTAEDVDATVLQGLERGDGVVFKNGTIFGVTGANKIYVAEDGKKRHIASEDVFNGLGYSWDNIIWINQFAGMAHKTGQPIYLRSEAETSPEEQAIKEETTIATTRPELDDTVITPGVMVTTPEDKKSIIGNEFITGVDGYLVADAETGTILAAKNIDTIRPIASLTKPLTAYVALGAGLDTNASATYDASKHKAKYHYYRIEQGESVKNDDLLKALLISSLNTPVYMVVEGVDPTPEAFVKRMNNQMTTWGLARTRFADPFGGEENLGTIREYHTIFRNTLRNADIKEDLGMNTYSYDETLDRDGLPGHHDNHSNHLMQRSNLDFKILASKTGYLDEAGANLAMLVERPSDGKQFYVITMGNPDYAGRFNEPQRLTSWALSQF